MVALAPVSYFEGLRMSEHLENISCFESCESSLNECL